jgi:anaerobic magnesium-protoporphyrin IX monomethyl ester cyclase
VQFTAAVPFPGTEYYRYCERNNFLNTKDWGKYHAANTALMRTEQMTAEEIEQAIVDVRKKIYFSPRFIFRRFSDIRNFHDAYAILQKGIQLIGK